MLLKFDGEFGGEVTCESCGAKYRVAGQTVSEL
jgi:uncharacterized Zn-finger protein